MNPAPRRPALAPRLAIGLVTTLSGFAGLAYEVSWTRVLSVALGTDALAAVGVVAGFFAGLAAGALALDGPLRRTRFPRLAYALLELAIAAWAGVSIWLLPAVSRVMPQVLGAQPPALLHWGAAFAAPALALLPATAAMGGTLVALERIASGRHGPRVSALVFGANTAGAMAGALASVFVLMPALGLSGTLAALAAVNLACAGGVFLTGVADDPGALPGLGAPPAAAGGARLLATLVATGCIGVAYEIVALRLAAQILQDTIYSFAVLLAAYLLGTASGALGWQYALSRWAAPPAQKTAGLLAALALTGLLTAAALPGIVAVSEWGALAGPLGEFVVAALLLLLPAAAMGATFGHLAQAVRDRRGSLGWAVGVNSLGAAAGPALAVLLLIPAVGAAKALVPLSLAYLLLLPVLAGRRRLALAIVPAALGAALWLRPAPLLVRVPPGGRLLASAEGAMVAASVVEDAEGTRFLDINGHFRMGGTSSLRSDWRQAQVPLLLHPAPRRALFLGVGTGATLQGAANLPGVQAEAVELAPEVVGLLPWFAEPPSPGAPPAPTIAPTVTVADARRFVAADTHFYDVVVADLFHPALDGSGALYAAEHFAAVRERLAPGGLFCQWLPLFQLDVPSLQAITRSFLQAFPHGTAWLAHYSVGTPMLALVGSRDGALRIDPAAMAARMAEASMQGPLQRTGLQSPLDMLGLFLAGPATLGRFAAGRPPNTDDRPFVALDAQRNVRVLSAHPGQTLRAVLRALRPDAWSSDAWSSDALGSDALGSDVGALLGEGVPEAARARLAAYWRARDRFIAAGLALPQGLEGRALIEAAVPGLLDTVRLSAEFDPAYEPLLSMAGALAGVDREAGRTLLAQIDAASPSRPEARALLRALRR